MTDNAPTADTSATQLWSDMKDAIRDAFSVWGDPAALAAQRAFRPIDARLLREWLGSFEATVRALLVAAAARMAPLLPPRAKRRTSAKAGTGGAAEPPAAPAEAPRSAPGDDASDDAPAAEGRAPDPPGSDPPGSDPPGSETWTGVRFRLVPGGRKAKARKTRARAGRAAPGALVPTLALARRFEALIRVVQNPEPHAKRLARLLAKDRYAAARVLARPKPLKCQDTGFDRPIPYGDILEDALALAWEALRAAPAQPDTS